MKKLLLTFCAALLTVGSAFSQTGYTGTLTADGNVSGEIKASLDGTTLKLWNIPNNGYMSSNPWGTESENYLTFDIVEHTATAKIENKDSQPAGKAGSFGYAYSGDVNSWTNIEGKFNENYQELNIPTIILKGQSFGTATNLTNISITFTTPLVVSGANDPSLSIEPIIFNDIDTFTIKVTAINIDNPENVKLFYNITGENNAYTEAQSSEALTYNITLSNLQAGESYTLYVYALYGEGEDEVKSEITRYTFVTPKAYGSGLMSWHPGSDSAPTESCNVNALYSGENNQFTISNFAGLPNPIIFSISEDGSCRATQSLTGTKNEYGTSYTYNGITGSGNVEGTIVNLSATSSKLTIEGWSQGYAPPYIKYYNTEIDFNFAIPDLPIPKPAATLTIEELKVTKITTTSAEVTYKLAATNVPDNATYSIIATIYGGMLKLGEKTGATGTITLPLESGTWENITFTATVSAEGKELATATQTVEEIIIPAVLTVGEPKVALAQVDDTFTATVTGTVTADEVSDFSALYQISYMIMPNVGNGAMMRSAQLSAAGSYSFSIEGLKPNTQYSVTISPSTTTTPSAACGNQVSVPFTTPAASTPTGPVEATGNMTSDNGSYSVSAVYNAEKQTLVLTGVGGSPNRLTFNVKADGSLESETRQIYDTDYDYDEDTGYEYYDVYYSDNVNGTAPTPYKVTGTAVNSGKNCVLTLGNIGAYSPEDGRFSKKWDNTVITLNGLNLDITASAEPTLEITSADYVITEDGYEFTVGVKAEGFASDSAVTVSYTIEPVITDLPAVTETADGTYTFTIPSASLTAGTEYTVTVKASAGALTAQAVKTFTASTSGTGDSDTDTVTLTGTYAKNYGFVFEKTDSNPFGVQFCLTYYGPNSTTGVGNWQVLGLYRNNYYTKTEDGNYLFLLPGSIDAEGKITPSSPNDFPSTRNQWVFSGDTGIVDAGLYEFSAQGPVLMQNQVLCVVECTGANTGEYGAIVYTVKDVRKVYRLLGGRFGNSLTTQTPFPAKDYNNAIQWVAGTPYTWTFNIEEITDFHYGDVVSGVESIETADDADARYFTLQGVEIVNPAAGTICIKVAAGKASKVVIR